MWILIHPPHNMRAGCAYSVIHNSIPIKDPTQIPIRVSISSVIVGSTVELFGVVTNHGQQSIFHHSSVQCKEAIAGSEQEGILFTQKTLIRRLMTLLSPSRTRPSRGTARISVLETQLSQAVRFMKETLNERVVIYLTDKQVDVVSCGSVLLDTLIRGQCHKVSRNLTLEER